MVFVAVGCDRGLRSRGTRIGEEQTDARACEVFRSGQSAEIGEGRIDRREIEGANALVLALKAEAYGGERPEW